MKMQEVVLLELENDMVFWKAGKMPIRYRFDVSMSTGWCPI
jgi:hypothetical protein